MLNTASTNILILLDMWIHSWTPLLTGLTRISLDLDESQQFVAGSAGHRPSKPNKPSPPLHTTSLNTHAYTITPTDRPTNQSAKPNVHQAPVHLKRYLSHSWTGISLVDRIMIYSQGHQNLIESGALPGSMLHVMAHPDIGS